MHMVAQKFALISSFQFYIPDLISSYYHEYFSLPFLISIYCMQHAYNM